MAWPVQRSVVRMLKGPERGEAQAAGGQRRAGPREEEEVWVHVIVHWASLAIRCLAFVAGASWVSGWSPSSLAPVPCRPDTQPDQPQSLCTAWGGGALRMRKPSFREGCTQLAWGEPGFGPRTAWPSPSAGPFLVMAQPGAGRQALCRRLPSSLGLPSRPQSGLLTLDRRS